MIKEVTNMNDNSNNTPVTVTDGQKSVKKRKGTVYKDLTPEQKNRNNQRATHWKKVQAIKYTVTVKRDSIAVEDSYIHRAIDSGVISNVSQAVLAAIRYAVSNDYLGIGLDSDSDSGSGGSGGKGN